MAGHLKDIVVLGELHLLQSCVLCKKTTGQQESAGSVKMNSPLL